MKKYKFLRFLLLTFLLSLLFSCDTVSKYNQHLNQEIPPIKITEDIDFAYSKLKKLHPELYWYLSKEQLDYKFDSLKKSVNRPIKPSEFYKKLAPVVAEVRQGHLSVVPPMKKLTKKEIKKLKNQKGLFSRFDYLVNNDKLYITENKENLYQIPAGTELLKVNHIPVEKLLTEYKNFIKSDGYNTTYIPYALARRWATYFTIENGIMDSVLVETRYENSYKTIWFKRETKSEKDKTVEKQTTKQKNIEKNKHYNPDTKNYNRDLIFKEKDSSIAVMTIRSFSGKNSKKFYKKSFEELKNAKTKFLIIDVRNNLGGSLAEITHLYRYLGTHYPFIKDIELTTYTSQLHADYFSDLSVWYKPIAAVFYPVYAAGMLLSNKCENGKVYLRNNQFVKQKPMKNSFSGQLYLLINGSSFSASSIIASKLKNDQRAILVGEETGGANDGNIAGRYSTITLPNSHLKIPIGLMLIQPNITFLNTQKGVTPHHEIIPTPSERFVKKDVEMEWILNQIRELNSKTQK